MLVSGQSITKNFHKEIAKNPDNTFNIVPTLCKVMQLGSLYLWPLCEVAEVSPDVYLNAGTLASLTEEEQQGVQLSRGQLERLGLCLPKINIIKVVPTPPKKSVHMQSRARK